MKVNECQLRGIAASPESRGRIRRVVRDGDYAILHCTRCGIRARADARSSSFRPENGKLVEHRDVVQDIPEKAVNPNGMS